MSLTAFMKRVVGILEESGVRYMLTGSLASAITQSRELPKIWMW